VNAFLSHREIARRAYKPCATRNSEPKPISGLLIALLITFVLSFGFGIDVCSMIAGAISQDKSQQEKQ